MAKKTTQADICKRILAAMGDDPEVAEFCKKFIERANRSSASTLRKLDCVWYYLIRNCYSEETAMTARAMARFLNENTPANPHYEDLNNWTTQGAGYYLRKLVKDSGEDFEVRELMGTDKETGNKNKMYYVASGYDYVIPVC